MRSVFATDAPGAQFVRTHPFFFSIRIRLVDHARAQMAGEQWDARPTRALGLLYTVAGVSNFAFQIFPQEAV
jgi:hypothetical protein